MVWLAGAAGLCSQFSGLEALLFGAVVSATDPVGALSVLAALALSAAAAQPALFAQGSAPAGSPLRAGEAVRVTLRPAPAHPVALRPAGSNPPRSVLCVHPQVTVLAVFERLHADPDLYALVFGESVLNDAVAIVLFRVLAGFLHAPVTAVAVLRAVGTFLLVFFGSLALGG